MLLSPSRQINTRNGGLLGVAMNGGGLLSGPMPSDAGDEWFLRRQREQQMAPSPAPAAPAPMAGPQRERVSPWRIFDRVLGGQTITEGLDEERTRLEAEANRPTLLARQAQLRGLAQQMGPAAMIAFETNPEKFGESLAEQYAPQVIAAGGIQSVIGNGQRVGAPNVREFGDRIAMTDPVTRATTYSDARQPTFGEETARINANNPVNVATGGKLVDPRSGETIAEGNASVYSASQGADLVRSDGSVLHENAPAPVARPAAAIEIDGQLRSLDTDVVPTIDRMEQLLQSGDVITGLGAEQRLFAARALAATGNEDARRRVAATEEFVNTSGRLRVGMAKSLGANPSNADIQLLERVTAGDIKQSSQGLLATIRQGRDLSTRQRQALQQQLSSFPAQGGGAAASSQGPIAEDGQGNRVQWNGSAWAPI